MTLFEPSGELHHQYLAASSLIHAHTSFLVVAHEGPDGDAIGSTLAMCHLLWNLGKKAIPFNVDPIPHNLRFFDGAAKMASALDDSETPEVTILLDCADKHRAGSAFPANGWGEKMLIIDHHQTGGGEGADIYIKDTSAAAVGEMIYRLSLVMAQPTTLAFAQCCYGSIMTDTGSFRYGNTSPLTFQIASKLLAAGVDPWEMTSAIYENDPLPRVKLLAKVLDTLAVSSCGRLAFVRVEEEMFAELPEATPDMLDGFVNYARRIQGVEVAIQMRAQAGGGYRLSFRSRGRVNVAALAVTFGGGGHHNAAGCTIARDAESIRELLTVRLSELLDAE